MAPSKVPKFGGWEAEEDVGYTVRFETVRKGNKPGGPIINPNDLQPNQFASPPVAAAATPPHQNKPKPKQPEFGAWGEEEEVPYTQYFENRGKVKTGPSEPQMNYNVVSNQPLKANPVVKANEALPRQGNTNTRPDDVHRPNGGRGMSSADPRAQPQGVKFINNESNGRQSPLHPGVAGRGRGNTPIDNKRGAPVGTRPRVHATAGPSPGRGGASVPVFGDWEKNPAQANGYTVMFNKLQDERNGVAPVDMTPTHPRYSSGRPTEPKQGGCFSCLFG